MIKCGSVPEPPAFCQRARVPGNRWLAVHPNAKRPRDYWSPFKGDLAAGFQMRCAYSAMFEPVGTVDHFVSWHQDRSLAYEWDNYRYSPGWINSSKLKEPSTNLLDPFDVEDGWFEIILPSLQLTVADSTPPEVRPLAEYTIKRLHLVHDERLMRQRSVWYQMFRRGDLPLSGLKRLAPLIAAAVEKSGQ